MVNTDIPYGGVAGFGELQPRLETGAPWHYHFDVNPLFLTLSEKLNILLRRTSDVAIIRSG